MCFFINAAYPQVNFLGKPGYMTTPTAGWEEERQLGLSFSYLPWEYSIFRPVSKANDSFFYSVRAGFVSFMDVNLSIAYRPDLSDEVGIGDRQLDFRFHLFKEGVIRPSVVVGWTPPGSVSPVLAHDYLVLSKNIHFLGNFQVTAGYGSPFILQRDKSIDGFFQSFLLKKKNEFGRSDYLQGIFGSIAYNPVDFAGLMVEYNTNTYNAGIFISIADQYYLQVYSLEGKSWALNIAAQFRLDLYPKALRRYEKDMD